jgi:steroid delta-isomerase-like uncharacterized protein
MSVQNTFKEMMDAFNQHNAKAFAALHTTEAVIYDPQYADPLQGREAIRKDVEDFFVTFPDVRATISGIVTNGDSLAYEIELRGTNEGPIITPDGTIPATNQRIVIRVGAFMRVNEQGLITDSRRYFDMAGLLQQLGLQ